MRVAYLTAGAGGMYCGSCMRDNTLVRALIRQKRNVTLIPVYSPIRTDEEDVSTSRVYYGGINVFLQQQSAIFRRAPRWLTRALDAPALLRAAMRRAGSYSSDSVGPLTVSILKGEDGAQRAELDKLVAGLAEWNPDVVHLPNAFFVGLARTLRERLRCAVVCTLTGEDVFLDTLAEPHRAEVVRLIRQRGRDVDAFLAVTRHYAAYAEAEFGIAADRLHYVPLGVALDGAASDPVVDDQTAARPFTIGYLARICPEKGLHLLCDAFVKLRESGRDCRLAVAGYLPASSQDYFKALRVQWRRRGLDPYVTYHGEVDRRGKMEFLASCDVLSVPTVYREAKGIYVLEALARGVPVVQPAHGSFPELIEATGGGILFEPGDNAALADAIASLMDDADLRRQLASRGRASVHESFNDDAMASRAWEVFERCAALVGAAAACNAAADGA